MDGYSFTQDPPQAVTDYLGNKSLTPSFSWQDIWAEEHAYAFTVAKATQLSVLTDIYEELQSAIESGQPFAEFKKNITPRLKARGWWGTKELTDPITGKTVRARLGSPARLRTIYWANVRSARAAGQWQRIQNSASILPYLTYELGPSEVHRPHHADKKGTILPINDPFWQEWYAPNGWGCKCWHRQISAAEAQKRGISTAPNIPRVKHRNSRTGEITTAPEGIDPGWNMNPGATRERNMRRFLAGTLERAPSDLALTAVRDLLSDSEFRAHMRGERLTAFPIAVAGQEVADAIGSKSRTLFLSQDTAKRHNDLIANKSYPAPEPFALIQEWIDRADIFDTQASTRPNQRFMLSFIADDGLTYWAGFKVTDEGELFLTTFFSKGRNRRNRQPKGKIIKSGEGN